MHWLLFAAAAILVAAAIVFIAGATLPRDHVAAVRARFAAKPEAVWALISDVSAAPAWRDGLRSVEPIPAIDGKPAWRETSKFGVITYALVESDPPRRMVTRIADDSLPYGGQWEYVISPHDSGSELTITERGFVKPPLFRFLSRYAFGYSSTLESIQQSIARRLGESVVPEVVNAGH